MGGDNVWDMTQAETHPVVDSTGTIVGVARAADLDGDIYPYPVYDEDDHDAQVGWIDAHGYWALGQPKAWCLDCISTVESIGENGERHVVRDTYGPNYTVTRTSAVTDADGNTTTTVETIMEDAYGPEGPTGSVND